MQPAVAGVGDLVAMSDAERADVRARIGDREFVRALRQQMVNRPLSTTKPIAASPARGPAGAAAPPTHDADHRPGVNPATKPIDLKADLTTMPKSQIDRLVKQHGAKAVAVELREQMRGRAIRLR